MSEYLDIDQTIAQERLLNALQLEFYFFGEDEFEDED